VEVFGERRNPELFQKNIAVIGPATARAVEKLDLPVSLLPQRYIAESLAESLEQNAAGASILLIRAEEARDVLPSALRQAGCRLTIVDAYRNCIPGDSISRLRELFNDPKGAPDLITFTSGSTSRNLVAILEAAGLAVPSEVVLASIGPITSRTLRELGLEPTVEAAEATISALVEAILHYFEQAGQSG